MRAFVRGSYPLVPSVLFAVCWAYGVTGLFALVDPSRGAWRPDAGTAVAAVTIAVDMLLMRIVDDIRDLPYDREHNPRRPLARGAVTVRTLLIWYVVLGVLLVAGNGFHPAAMVVLVVQLLYAPLLLRWPDPGRLVLTVVLSSPVQLLLHLYLYLHYLRTVDHTFGTSFWPALLIVSLATLHLELAKKITRDPQPGERTYVTVFGLAGTVRAAVVSAFAAAAVLIAAARPATWWVLLTLLPLALPVTAWWRFRRADRWDPRLAVGFLLVTFTLWAVTALLGR